MTASKDWPIFQLDVNNAFLHGCLDEEVYMHPPPGYTVPSPQHKCLLKKSLYGLKQASRQWNQVFSSTLCKFGFVQCPFDPCLFIFRNQSTFLVLLVYVDDILLTGNSLDTISEVKQFLQQEFSIKDLGIAKFFLGIELQRSSSGLLLHQHKYITDLLHQAGFTATKPAVTPLPPGTQLSEDKSPFLSDPSQYRRLIGKLLYLNFTRPDVSHAVQHLSQFVQHPTEAQFKAALHVLKYLSGCPHLGLFYPSHCPSFLHCYSDADWASCKTSRKSLTGFCIFLGPSLISWKTKKQSTVSCSSAEAEYRSMASVTRELQWISYLLQDLAFSIPLPIPLRCDNQAALHITSNPVFHERTKHIELDCHVVRNQYLKGFLDPQFLSTKLQLADFFTKSLAASPFSVFLGKLGLSFAQLQLEGGVMK